MTRRRKREPIPCDNEECRVVVDNTCAISVTLHICQPCARRLMLETATILVTLRDYAQPANHEATP